MHQQPPAIWNIDALLKVPEATSHNCLGSHTYTVPTPQCRAATGSPARVLRGKANSTWAQISADRLQAFVPLEVASELRKCATSYRLCMTSQCVKAATACMMHSHLPTLIPTHQPMQHRHHPPTQTHTLALTPCAPTESFALNEHFLCSMLSVSNAARSHPKAITKLPTMQRQPDSC